nr:hypothetical protein [Marinobacter salsuginis]
MRYKGWLSRIALAIFAVSFVVLGYLGLVPASLRSYHRRPDPDRCTYFILMPPTRVWKPARQRGDRIMRKLDLVFHAILPALGYCWRCSIIDYLFAA